MGVFGVRICNKSKAAGLVRGAVGINANHEHNGRSVGDVCVVAATFT